MILTAATGLRSPPSHSRRPALRIDAPSPLSMIGQHGGRGMAGRVQDLRHAAIRERVAGAQQRRRPDVRASPDRIGEIVERGLGAQKLPPEREQALPHGGERRRAVGSAAH